MTGTDSAPGARCPSCDAELPDNAKFCGMCGRRTEAPASDDDWIGKVVAGRYRVLRKLGQGGMGVVFEVEQTRLGKKAAMKVLSARLAGEERVQRRFKREAEAAARLTHAGVAQVIDFGWDRGRPYLVMELVHGEDLGEVLDRDGTMVPARAAAILTGLAAPIDQAHAHGIVHRDLKPENVLLARDRDGNELVKVLDFGLAELAEQADAPDETGAGAIAGTPAYMAPEQIRGEPLDARADVYALACVAYRILCGAPPFTAHTALGVLTKHLTDTPVKPSVRAPGPGVGAALDAVVMGGLDKQREGRPASAGAFASAFAAAAVEDARTAGMSTGPLHAAQAVKGAHAIEPTTAERRAVVDSSDDLKRADVDAFERWLDRRRRMRLIGIPLLLVAGGVGGTLLWRRHEARPRAEEVEPNDHPGDATRVAPGLVKGARGNGGADRDTLRVIAARPAGATLAVRVTPAEGDDVALALLAPDGRVIAAVDEGAAGIPEDLPIVRVDDLDGDPLVRVEGGARGGGGGAWTVEITAGVAKPGIEVEPDDTDSDAGALTVGEKLSGTSFRQGDLDRVRVRGASGKIRIGLDGAGVAGLRVRVRGGPATKAPMTATLADGDVVEVLRAPDAPAGTIAYELSLSPAGTIPRR